MQNRIAQREFRQVRLLLFVFPLTKRDFRVDPLLFYLQRKQQYIKELEAKVAFYETGREGQVERLSEAVNQLLEENLKLRGLLASLGGFIGEGVGGVLPKLGMELPGVLLLVYTPFLPLFLTPIQTEFNELVAKTVLDNAKDVLDLPVLDKPRSSTAPSSSAAAASAPYPSTSAQTLDSAMPLPPPPPPPIARPQTSSAPPRRASQPTPSPQFSLPPAPLPRPQSPLPAFPQFGLPTAFPPPPLGYDPLSAATAALTSGLPPPPSTSTSTDEICDNYVRRICTDDEEQLNRAIDGIQDTFSMVADTPQVEAFKLIACSSLSFLIFLSLRWPDVLNGFPPQTTCETSAITPLITSRHLSASQSRKLPFLTTSSSTGTSPSLPSSPPSSRLLTLPSSTLSAFCRLPLSPLPSVPPAALSSPPSATVSSSSRTSSEWRTSHGTSRPRL